MGIEATKISVLDQELRRYLPRFNFEDALAGVGWTNADSITGEKYNVYISTTQITSFSTAVSAVTSVSEIDQDYKYTTPAESDQKLHFGIGVAHALTTPTAGENATWETNLQGTTDTTEGRVFLDHFAGQTFTAPGKELTRAEFKIAKTGIVGSDLQLDLIEWQGDYETSLSSLVVLASKVLPEERFTSTVTQVVFPMFTGDMTSTSSYLLHFTLANTTQGGHSQYYSVKMQDSIEHTGGTVYMGQSRIPASVDSSMSNSLWMQVEQCLYVWIPTVTNNVFVEMALEADPSYRYQMARAPRASRRSESNPITVSKRSVNANLHTRQSDEKTRFRFELRSPRAQTESLRQFWLSQEPLLLSYFPQAENSVSGMGHKHRVSWPGPFGYDEWEQMASWDHLFGKFDLESI